MKKILLIIQQQLNLHNLIAMETSRLLMMLSLSADKDRE